LFNSLDILNGFIIHICSNIQIFFSESQVSEAERAEICWTNYPASLCLRDNSTLRFKLHGDRFQRVSLKITKTNSFFHAIRRKYDFLELLFIDSMFFRISPFLKGDWGGFWGGSWKSSLPSFSKGGYAKM